ncbi:A-kinase anchor protein 3 [Tachyglossus aculeatus]|uniref:A-kinase anchor protein 3 n=1 Tax=Tachyglossus aculeatus TaxID=9261 RepID=UPI0018F3D724|nr:A-kinase anchor protein 3 [Tachyglossus aculeatus]XP_038623698.1 A-kinase anchor protein 3 [Tachyglossus aculeatus]XP_038623699.1 A-kinase anchor protein 3 [Tachyglossus aculeatus]
MSDKVDWLQSRSGVCKVDVYAPEDGQEQGWKMTEETLSMLKDAPSDPVQVLSRLRRDLERCTLGLQATGLPPPAATDPAADTRSTFAMDYCTSGPGGVPGKLRLEVTSTSPSRPSSGRSEAPPAECSVDEVSFYANRLTNLVIAMARKEIGEKADGGEQPCVHRGDRASEVGPPAGQSPSMVAAQLVDAAVSHCSGEVARDRAPGDGDRARVGSRSPPQLRYMSKMKVRETTRPPGAGARPSSKKTVFYKEVLEAREAGGRRGLLGEGRARTGAASARPERTNDFAASVSQGIVTYANSVVSDMMVSIMKTLKIQVQDTTVATILLKRVLLRHAKEVVSDLIDSFMKNLHNVTGSLMTDTDFVSAVKRSLFDHGSQKATDIMDAMLGKLHTVMVAQPPAEKSDRVSFLSVNTTQDGRGRGRGVSCSAMRAEAKARGRPSTPGAAAPGPARDKTCAETLGEHLIKEGLTLWHKNQQKGGGSPLIQRGCLKNPGQPTARPDRKAGAETPQLIIPAPGKGLLGKPEPLPPNTDSWAKDLIVSALLLIQYHLAQQGATLDPQAFVEAAGGAPAAPAPPSPASTPSQALPSSGQDSLKSAQEATRPREDSDKRDLMGIFFNFVKNLLTETIFKSDEAPDPKPDSKQATSGTQGGEATRPGSSRSSGGGSGGGGPLAGLTKMVAHQLDGGVPGQLVENLMDSVMKLCLIIANSCDVPLGGLVGAKPGGGGWPAPAVPEGASDGLPDAGMAEAVLHNAFQAIQNELRLGLGPSDRPPPPIGPVPKVVVSNHSVADTVQNKQLQAVLQWVAASELNVPILYFAGDDEGIQEKLLQLSATAVNKGRSVGEVLQAVLRYEKERQLDEAVGNVTRLQLLDWLLVNL